MKRYKYPRTYHVPWSPGATSDDKTLKIYDGLYHEIFNEPEQAEVRADLLAWIEQRLPAGD